MRFLERQIPGESGSPDVVVLSCAQAAPMSGLPILEFETQVEALLDRGCRRIVINLQPLERFDSRTIQALLHASQFCRRQDARLVLSDPPAMLRRTLTTLGLDPALTSFASDDEAVRSFQRGGRRSAQPIDE